MLILFFVLIANISYANDDLTTEQMLSEYAEILNHVTEENQEQTEFTVFMKNSNTTYTITRSDIKEKIFEKNGRNIVRNT